MSTNKDIAHSTWFDFAHHKPLRADGESNRTIARSASIIGLFTLCSRILGFIRDVVIARMFGVYLYAQAFVIAFKIPNLLRDLVGEGAANAAFVPVLSEYNAKHTKEEFWELVNCLLNSMLVILMSLTILGIAFAPVIVRLIAPGFIASPEKLETTIRLTRLLFPYILLAGLAAYAMGILNTLKHFSISAFAPCLMNIAIIICALLFGERTAGLASGVLIGGFLQLAVQIPVLYKKGFRLTLFKRFKHPGAGAVGRLMAPRVVSSSIYQLNNFVDSIFGSLARIVGEGGVAVLYFSYRLIQFPLGIFSNALSQAILPAFSTQVLEDTHDTLRHTLSWGLRCVFFVMLPASAAFMALSTPIIAALFGGKRFDAYSIQQTSSALFFYSIGLSSYGATKVLQSAFFALKDTVTPTKAALVALVSNVILNALLIVPFKIGGIALATSLSGINTFLILFVILKKRLGGLKVNEIADSFARILIASVCMGAVCYFVSVKTAAFHKVVSLSFSIISGLASYVIFCFIFRVNEIGQLWKWMRRDRTI
ncbi:MAG TPA: murein biosynthesis integral membrane protein MurJ [Candidatus Omnitrophica bacterium]|nr:murein biosynthesis integral membrane protein MurJ [Candidatus Omnitrophota bacterium]HBG63751.1 murein biosynthesis integral membrane protein MurJ [Candidatus Omnitrophota bacterium]